MLEKIRAGWGRIKNIGSRTAASPVEKPGAGTEKAEAKIIPMSLIADVIITFLGNEEKGIENIRIKLGPSNHPNKLDLDLEIETRKPFTTTGVKLSARLINQGNSIAVEEGYDLQSKSATGSNAYEILDKHINSIGIRLKEAIEHIEGKKVAKMEIENGELKVTFGATKPESAPAPEMWTAEKEQELKDVEKQIAELEYVMRFIDEELNKGRKDLERYASTGDPNNLTEFTTNEINLLESNPIEYLVKERDSKQSTLNFVLQDETYSELEKENQKILYTKIIAGWQKMIDALESLNPRY